jgi:hypothetical protein
MARGPGRRPSSTGRSRLLVFATLALTLAACSRGGGGDGDGGGGVATPPNSLTVEMFDYGYRFAGTVEAGAVTITTANTGREWHMATFGRLQPGKTVADVVAFLDAQSAGNLPEGEEEGAEPPGIDSLIAKGLGAPGHILQPGHRQSLTVDTLDAGSYVMLCYLPVEGLGTPHFSKGMIGGFEVGPAGAAIPPQKADFDVSLGDSTDPTGLPTELSSGMHTFKVTSTGTGGKDFTISQLDAGQTLGSFAVYFATEFPRPGGPPVGTADRAPGKVFGSTFQIEAGHSVWLTVDLPPGDTYFDSATNVTGGNPVHKVVSAKVT